MAISAYKTIDELRNVEQLDAQVDRRAYERYPASLQARLFFGNMIYSGKVTNISKKGMFVNTNIRFPVNTEFMMVVLLNNRTVKIPIKVRRTIKRESGYNSRTDCGIGVELLDAPQPYIDFVGTRKSTRQVSY